MLKLNPNGEDYRNACVIMCAKHMRKHVIFSFSISFAVHDFHVYKAIWESPAPGEEWGYQCKVGNLHDPLSVAVINRHTEKTQL